MLIHGPMLLKPNIILKVYQNLASISDLSLSTDCEIALSKYFTNMD